MAPEHTTARHTATIGLDIGTSSAKAVAFRRDGRILASAGRPYLLQQPQPGFAEQDPGELVSAAMECLTQVLADSRGQATITGISISTAMHGIMALDTGYKPLTPILTWADTRSVDETDEFRGLPEAPALYSCTGVPIHPMSPLCKLAWMRRHRPDVMAAARKFVGIKEYLLHHLTGEWIVDYSIASATGLFDIHQLDWSAFALSLAGIDRSQLPIPVEGTKAFPLSPAAALSLGCTGIPVFPGGSDGCLANLGSGAMEEGLMALTIGTSGAVRMTVPKPAPDPKGRLFNYILLPGAFVSGGPVNNGGIILKWFSESILGKPFGSKTDFKWFLDEISAVPPGAEGLTCLPWFLGERAPVWNARATGTFQGLTITHSRKHMMRAIVEGISFNLRQVADILSAQAAPVRKIIASGGFTASTAWVQMMADIFQVPVYRTTQEDASATGAAMLGFIGTGEARDWRDFGQWTSDRETFVPAPGQLAAYAEAYARYTAIAASASSITAHT